MLQFFASITGGGPLAARPAAPEELISKLVDDWTLQKLESLKGYLCAFTSAAKDQGFNAAYIDAFAGANYCGDNMGDASALTGFADLANVSAKMLLKQSMRTALMSEPAFDGYVFIERDRRRGHVLEALRREFAHCNIQIRRIEVNRELRRISRLDWEVRRAVLLVDAYAANLEWETVTAISRTKAINLWLLFPVGIGSDQPSARAVSFPPLWHDRLQVLTQTEERLLDPQAPVSACEALVDTLGHCLANRLKDTFVNVSAPHVMRNASGAPLYVHCFASAVPGLEGRSAVALADQLLETMRR